MLWSFWLAVSLTVTFLGRTGGQLHPREPAQYRTLPALREQAVILDRWRDERVARIPELLKKHKVDAWLVILSFSDYLYRH